MNEVLAIPDRSDGPQAWCRWAWLSGRRPVNNPETKTTLRDVILDNGFGDEVRLTALSAFWTLYELDEIVELQHQLIANHEMALAVSALLHPRWSHNEDWLTACGDWVGVNQDIDEAVIRLWNWADRPIDSVRIPREVLERADIIDVPSIDWRHCLEVGLERAHTPPHSPFEGFWQQHVTDWAAHWLQWEEQIWLYNWRLHEETMLTEWTQSQPYPTVRPVSPTTTVIKIDEARKASEALCFTMLGLGYVLQRNADDHVAAKWDSLWASWSSSLNYATFEVMSNVQTTEWHIGGLTGALRDLYAMKRWGLQLD